MISCTQSRKSRIRKSAFEGFHVYKTLFLVDRHPVYYNIYFKIYKKYIFALFMENSTWIRVDIRNRGFWAFQPRVISGKSEISVSSRLSWFTLSWLSGSSPPPRVLLRPRFLSCSQTLGKPWLMPFQLTVNVGGTGIIFHAGLSERAVLSSLSPLNSLPTFLQFILSRRLLRRTHS